MALVDETIIGLNPWWTNPGWVASDPHLAELDRRGVRLEPPPFVDSIRLDAAGTHVVRGPRQVGKSTGLKLVAASAASQGVLPRTLVYLALDLLADQSVAEVARTIGRARQLASPAGPVILLLDEVTSVPRWATALKSLWDAGVTREDVIVCTGSSALDLAAGHVEGLPGRRGSGQDHLVLPQSFAAFARAMDGTVPPSPGLTIGGAVSQYDLLSEHAVFVPALETALERFLRFGGLPAAVAEAAADAPTPSAETSRVAWDSLSRELLRHGASEVSTRALLERVVRSLGSKTNWSALAREMDVPLGGRRTPPDHRSVRDYVELLARCYELMLVYFRKPGSGTNDLAKDKKIFFADPLLHHLTVERSPGLSYDVAAAVENAIAVALHRRYEPLESQTAGLADPTSIHVWETRTPKEIDFACGHSDALDLVEVKYSSRIGRADARTLATAFPGRPAVIASRSDLRLESDHAIVPAALLLWALG